MSKCGVAWGFWGWLPAHSALSVFDAAAAAFPNCVDCQEEKRWLSYDMLMMTTASPKKTGNCMYILCSVSFLPYLLKNLKNKIAYYPQVLFRTHNRVLLEARSTA